MNPNQMTRGVGDENAQQAHMAQNLEFEVLTLDSQGSVTERTTRRAQQFAEDLGSGIVLELVAIPAGVFLMGSPKGKGYEDEHPQHAVTLALFRMGRYLVTQEQWKAVMGTTARCRFQGARRPVENISWVHL